jgi:D-alanyl-D-alanine carboxypeptidase
MVHRIRPAILGVAVAVLVATLPTSRSAFAREPAPRFEASQAPVPEDLAARMRKHSWRDGCPIPIGELSYLRLSYIGFDGMVHQGDLLVHRSLAAEVVAIFRDLFVQRFPIDKMRLIDEYGGDDDASMADNNTSAFNCRFVAGKPGIFSKHSGGRAIDINPRTNPMVVGDAVFPPAGAAFLDRHARARGLLSSGDRAVRAFVRRGWVWGGAWRSLKDYQHFEK